MQITNSFINKHCERIKCAAYAAALIKVERMLGPQHRAVMREGYVEGEGKGIWELALA